MPSSVPDFGSHYPPAHDIGETLDSLLEYTGAGGGWLAWRDSSGQLQMPVRRGQVADEWLTLQQARGNVWGFTLGAGVALLSDLSSLPGLEAAPLHNLLSCPLGPEPGAGALVLVNKPGGFSSDDVAVLRGVAHLLHRKPRQARSPAELVPSSAAWWQRVLDRSGEGILILDDAGTLLYANATWQEWTGFGAAELAGRPAPFPFWVSLRDLSQLQAQAAPSRVVPFRRSDQSLFWCRVEMVREEWQGRAVQVGFLQQVAVPSVGRGAGTPGPSGPSDALPQIADELPLAVGLVDAHGRLRWGNAALQRLTFAAAHPGQPLREVFAPAPAAKLEMMLRQAAISAEPSQMGSLVLQPAPAPLTAYWLALRLQDGLGFLLALTDSPDGFVLVGQRRERMPELPPDVHSLVILLGRDEGVRYWDERWQELTGLSTAEVHGQPAEMVLDWLFPRQHDRERVADYLLQQPPQGGQGIFELLAPTGSRPFLCTFLPLLEPFDLPGAQAGERPGSRPNWLLLVSDARGLGAESGLARAFVHQLTWGLRRLLEAPLYLTQGLSEILLDHQDLPADLAGQLSQVIDSCRRLQPLLTALEQLAMTSPGAMHVVALGAVVESFCREHRGRQPYSLQVRIDDPEVRVRIQPALLRVVLDHLLSNAEQALTAEGPRRIEVRVATSKGMACCEVRDSGVGLPEPERMLPLLPFVSTKGPFARDPDRAALPAAGLGLTVCRHLLALMEGRLELHSIPEGGTRAVFLLPPSSGISEPEA